MAKERKQLDRRWLWLGVAIILAIVFFTARSLLQQRLPVRVVEVTRTQLIRTLDTNGRVEPVAPYEFHSPLATAVLKVYVQPGDRVPAGKLLMQLDDVEAKARMAAAESGVKAAQAALEAATHNGTQAERQAAEADLARARLDHDQAQRDLDALTKLNGTGAASASEVAAAKQRLETAQSAVHAAEQNATNHYSPAEVARATSALTDAESNLAAARQVEQQTSYYAPVSGTVYKVEAQATEFVDAGKLLIEMADLANVRVRAYFDEPEIGQLAVGQAILIRWDAKQGQVWYGSIIRLPSTITTFGTRNVGEVLVAIDNPNDVLLPDTNVTVTVTTHSEPNVLSVPREALHSENGKYYVYRVVNDGLQRAPVTPGTITLTQVAILTGLSEGEWVATGTTNGLPLQLGVRIRKIQ